MLRSSFFVGGERGQIIDKREERIDKRCGGKTDGRFSFEFMGGDFRGLEDAETEDHFVGRAVSCGFCQTKREMFFEWKNLKNKEQRINNNCGGKITG